MQHLTGSGANAYNKHETYGRWSCMSGRKLSAGKVKKHKFQNPTTYTC